MRLACGYEVGVGTEVQSDPTALEPAAAAGRQRRRLGHLDEAEHLPVPLSRRLFGAHRDRNLDVVESDPFGSGKSDLAFGVLAHLYYACLHLDVDARGTLMTVT